MVGPIIADEERLRSRHPVVPAVRKLLYELSKLSIRAAQWIDYKWDVKYGEDQSELLFFVPKPRARPLGIGLPDLFVYDFTAFALVLEDSSYPYTNEDLLLHQAVDVAH